jgi:hypothetical protein
LIICREAPWCNPFLNFASFSGKFAFLNDLGSNEYEQVNLSTLSLSLPKNLPIQGGQPKWDAHFCLGLNVFKQAADDNSFAVIKQYLCLRLAHVNDSDNLSLLLGSGGRSCSNTGAGRSNARVHNHINVAFFADLRHDIQA